MLIAKVPVGYLNSGELLFAAITLYDVGRSVERAWGSDQFVVYVALAFAVAQVAALLGLRLAGPTLVIAALVAQFRALVPRSILFRVSPFGSADRSTSGDRGRVAPWSSDKTFIYVSAVQACTGSGHSIIAGTLGYALGLAWREVRPQFRFPWAISRDGDDAGEYTGVEESAAAPAAASGSNPLASFVAPSVPAGGPASTAVSERDIERLLDMLDVTREQAERALEQANGSLERAINMLLE